MNEYFKQFFSSFAPNVQLTEDDLSRFSNMYGDDMVKFAYDFEKNYLKPEGKLLHSDTYDSIIKNQEEIRNFNTEQEKLNLNTSEYKPSDLKYQEQPINQWLGNYKDFFNNVESVNHRDMLKNAYEPFGFIVRETHLGALTEKGGKGITIIAPNGKDSFVVMPSYEGELIDSDLSDVFDSNKHKDLISFINEHAPKPGSPEYKTGQAERALLFDQGLEYINATALTDQEKNEIDTFVGNPDLFKPITEEVTIPAGQYAYRTSTRTFTPYEKELLQAENYIRNNNPEYQIINEEDGSYPNIPQDQIETEARQIIKRNKQTEIQQNRKINFIEDGNYFFHKSQDEQNRYGLGEAIVRTQADENAVKKQDQLILDVTTYEDNLAFIEKFQDPNYKSTILEGEEVVREDGLTYTEDNWVELKNGNTVSKIDFEKYKKAIQDNVSNINNLKKDRDDILQYYKVLGDLSPDILNRDLRLSSMFSNLLLAETVDGAYGMLRYPVGWAQHVTPDSWGNVVEKMDVATYGYTQDLRNAVRPVRKIALSDLNPFDGKDSNMGLDFVLQGASQMLPFIAFTMAGGAGARMLALKGGLTPVTAGHVANAARFSSMVMNVGGRRMRDFTIEEKANPFSDKHSLFYKNAFSTMYGIPEATFEYLTTIRFLKNIGRNNRNVIIGNKENLYKHVMGRLTGGYEFMPVREGVGEWLTEFFQNMVEGEDLLQNTTHAGLTGLMMGFGMGGFDYTQSYLHQNNMDSETLKKWKPYADQYNEVDSRINQLEATYLRAQGGGKISDELNEKTKKKLEELKARRDNLDKKFNEYWDEVFDRADFSKDGWNHIKQHAKRGFEIRKEIEKILKDTPPGRDRDKLLEPLYEEAEVLQSSREFYKRNPDNLYVLLPQEEKDKYLDRARKRNPKIKDTKKLEILANDILNEDLYLEDMKVQEENAKSSKGKLKLKNLSTKAKALKYIDDIIANNNLSLKDAAELLKVKQNIQDGTQNGFHWVDPKDGVTWAVGIQDNAVSNARTKTFSHEVGHAVFTATFGGLNTPESKKLLGQMATSIQDYLKKHEHDTYVKLQLRLGNYKGIERSEETLTFLLEEMPNINNKTMSPLLHSFLTAAGIQVKTLRETIEWWNDLAGKITKGKLKFEDFKTVDVKDLNLRKSVEATYADGRDVLNKEVQKLIYKYNEDSEEWEIGDKEYQPGESIGRDVGSQLLTVAFDKKLFDTFILGKKPNIQKDQIKKYIDDVYARLFDHMSNFTPILKNGKRNIDSLGRPDIYGWVMGWLGFKALDVSKKIFDEGARVAKQTQLDKAKELANEEATKQYLEEEFGKYTEDIGVTPELQKILTNVISVIIAKYEKGLKEDLSINKTYPDFISDINKELVKNYKDIIDWHGSGKTYAKFLTKNLPTIIGNIRTEYLSKNFPEMVEKVIFKEEDKGYRPYSEWKGKQIARERSAKTGRTSGNQLMRKNWKVINTMINDKGEFINQEIIDLFVNVQNKREGLAKQIAVDAGKEIMTNDLIQYNINQPKFNNLTQEKAEKLLETTPIARRLVNNQDIISDGLNDSFASEVIRQQDLGLRSSTEAKSSVEAFKVIQNFNKNTKGFRVKFNTHFPRFVKLLSKMPVEDAVKKIYTDVLTPNQVKKVAKALTTIYNDIFTPYTESIGTGAAMKFRTWYALNMQELSNTNSISLYAESMFPELKDVDIQEKSNDLEVAKKHRNLTASWVLNRKNEDGKVDIEENIKVVFDFHIGHLATAYQIGKWLGVRKDGSLYEMRGKNRRDSKGNLKDSRLQFFLDPKDVARYLNDTVPEVDELKIIMGKERGKQTPLLVGKVNGKDFTYEIKTKIPQKGSAINYKGDLSKDSAAEAEKAGKELLKFYAYIKTLYDQGKINEVDLVLVYRGMNSNMNTMLRRAANVRYKYIGKKMKPELLRYEHVIPADYVNVVLFDYFHNTKTEHTKDDIEQLLEDYHVALIPVKMDKVLDRFFRNTMPITYKIGDNALMKRYFNLLHINAKDMYALEDLSDPKASPIGEIFTKGHDYGFRNSLSEKSFDFVLATQKSVDLNAVEKGASIIDFDDTLAVTTSKITYEIPRRFPDGRFNPAVVGWGAIPDKGSLTPAEFAKQHDMLKDYGAVFDFSEFYDVKKGKKGPFFNKTKSLLEKFGNENIFILTARPQEAAPAIQAFLKGVGLDIKIENIIGLEDGSPQAKANQLIKMSSDGYNSFLFADDQIKNVEAVSKVINALDVNGKVYKLRIKHSKEAITPKALDTILDENNPDSPVTGKKKLTKEEAQFYGKPKPWYKILLDLKSKTNVIFVPPSAEDLKGLWNNHIAGKGKKGEADVLWFEETIIRPYARGERAMDTTRLFMIDKLSALYDIYGKDFKKKLKEKGYSGIFTMQDAVRMYIWDKLGYKIPGNQINIRKTINKLKKDNDLRTFADKLLNEVYNQGSKKYKIDYAQPIKGWMDQGIDSDITVSILKARSNLFKEFFDNKNKVFTEDNMNKIEAIYGKDFRVAMEDIFYRMENGINRNAKDMNNFWIKWLNAGVGNIMFINVRSALLQITSFTNFMDIIGDNNPMSAMARFANFPKFKKDLLMIWNSNFLKARRLRGKTDIAMNEILEGIDSSQDFFWKLSQNLMRLGYKPTQLGDSFAIALGGASFYRNRFNTYTELGKSKTEAHNRAMRDLRERAEEVQQSARADLISQQQASIAGRIFLSFQNVTMQYTRIAKKLLVDLKNKRRVKKPDGTYYSVGQSRILQLGRIGMYLGYQHLIFQGLQQGILAMLAFNDDDEKEITEKQKINYLNGVLDAVMRGMGILGGILSVAKNIAIEVSRGDSYRAQNAILDVSPAAKSKYTKAKKIIRAAEKGKLVDLAIETPSFLYGLPTDRVVKLIDQIGYGTNLYGEDYEKYQRIMLLLGWSHWNFYDTPPRTNILNLLEMKALQEKYGDINKMTDYEFQQIKNIEKQIKEYENK